MEQYFVFVFGVKFLFRPGITAIARGVARGGPGVPVTPHL